MHTGVVEYRQRRMGCARPLQRVAECAKPDSCVVSLDGGQAAAALSKLERIGLLMLCLLLWVMLGEGVFFLVALGAGYRIFTKDIPAQPSRATSAYFAALLIALGIIMKLIPGSGFGPR